MHWGFLYTAYNWYAGYWELVINLRKYIFVLVITIGYQVNLYVLFGALIIVALLFINLELQVPEVRCGCETAVLLIFRTQRCAGHQDVVVWPVLFPLSLSLCVCGCVCVCVGSLDRLVEGCHTQDCNCAE